ncbi:hypothetical protein [Bradyrhizobium sp. Leo121]|uniref:hypothetical protein n=1 Tax=Bradyrhizobium sp. Leo121 TaxID=1571195 RepID=UPI0010292048|nr:hypothetical protein [Bradyrhizobium sp. Leo121]RZN31966.1 hypothetical protein CWO90_15300 [Bradyrhizobium sp. Leo121]
MSLFARTDYEIIVDAVQAARRVLGENIEPGQPRNATVTVHRLLGLLDNRDVHAVLKRIDLRNTFELVSVET